MKDVSFSLREGEFALLCGMTGSGKSTLLRLIKREIAPHGEERGEILLGGRPICGRSVCKETGRIGFVMQCPDEQIVTDRVSAELAFGLENMGLAPDVIARRVGEMACYFGIEEWFDRDVSTLSGGQKQLLNLASVMVMNPDLLILDEPTSRLDPIAASEFLRTLKQLSRDFSLTVLVTEHRLEEWIPEADRLLVMEQGRLIANGAPRAVLAALDEGAPFFAAMPTASRIHRALGSDGDCPLSVREGREWLARAYPTWKDASASADNRDAEAPAHGKGSRPALEFRDVCFRYERQSPDVLRSLCFSVREGEIFCILGGNGSGKSTALACAAGIRRPYSGQIRVFDRPLGAYRGQSLYRDCLALLPQEVQDVFLFHTVREELADAGISLDSDDSASFLPFDLTPLLDHHPYDLSGGEQQLLALAKVLASHPRLLLLDEPTKGLDTLKTNALTEVLRQLRDAGMTVVIVTHDAEFAAGTADRCALFFRGEVVSIAPPIPFFTENRFYTTAAARISRGHAACGITAEQIVAHCRKQGNRSSDAWSSAPAQGGECP